MRWQRARYEYWEERGDKPINQRTSVSQERSYTAREAYILEIRPDMLDIITRTIDLTTAKYTPLF